MAIENFVKDMPGIASYSECWREVIGPEGEWSRSKIMIGK
jgi:hypothetical protein